MVTLGGQLIDLAGTMSGGGVKVARGRMGSSLVGSEDVSPQRLQAMEGRLEKAVSEANVCAVCVCVCVITLSSLYVYTSPWFLSNFKHRRKIVPA